VEAESAKSFLIGLPNTARLPLFSGPQSPLAEKTEKEGFPMISN